MNDSTRSLADGYIADELNAEQLAALEDLLRNDEAARLEFLAHLEVHSGLAWSHRGSENIISFPAKTKILHWALPIAAALALLATLSILFFKPNASLDIVTVTASLHGQWADGGEVATGTGLGAGLWELQSGLVELKTGTGTTLLLEGPASLRLNDKLHARLVSGNLVVRMPKGKSGFVVDTPKMKVTDLGTEFGVSVSTDGESRVQVYDGKVRAESSGSKDKELEAGQTVFCSADGAMLPAEFSEDRFIRTFPLIEIEDRLGGPLYSKSTIDSIHATTATTSPVIDGDLSDWSLSEAFRASCLPPYESTYYSEGMVRYDSENLYLAAHVGDPAPMKNAARPGFEFAGGSVIFRIAADRALGWPLKGTTLDARSPRPLPDSINEKISSIVMWYDANTSQPQIQILHAFDSHIRNTNPPGWTGAFRKDEDGLGYTLEYRIPWALLECAENPPRAGDQLGALWMTHWSDEQGRVCRGQLVDVTNPDPAATSGVQPYMFFQHGPAWGKIEFK